MASTKGINWPNYYHPKNAQIHVINEANIPAQADAVWACLIHAPYWPTWSNCKTSVQVLNGDGIELTKGSIFRWNTTRMNFDCTVVEYIPYERIAWRGKCGDVDMYHAWLLEPASNGVNIITETTQRGGLTWLTKYFTPKSITKHHQKWLEELRRQSK
ncbi:SRPBCC domain-containing protein [Photobacterium minamisatsumaniensis]|uniref:SRPBCC domain-containing protein n=1 Tax=Photobacterium minamisatsumaniensis TaxID=2910233 RepID=UPI003D150753